MEYILAILFIHIWFLIIGRILFLIYIRNLFPAKNEEFVRLRMKDAIASTVQEELFGNQFAEFGWAPHDFHYNRRRCMAGYSHPDDPRTMHMGSFNSNLFD